jgi:hypothetical protein
MDGQAGFMRGLTVPSRGLLLGVPQVVDEGGYVGEGLVQLAAQVQCIPVLAVVEDDRIGLDVAGAMRGLGLLAYVSAQLPHADRAWMSPAGVRVKVSASLAASRCRAFLVLLVLVVMCPAASASAWDGVTAWGLHPIAAGVVEPGVEVKLRLLDALEW